MWRSGKMEENETFKLMITEYLEQGPVYIFFFLRCADIWGAKQRKLLEAWSALDFTYFEQKLITDTPRDVSDECPRRARLAETGNNNTMILFNFVSVLLRRTTRFLLVLEGGHSSHDLQVMSLWKVLFYLFRQYCVQLSA